MCDGVGEFGGKFEVVSVGVMRVVVGVVKMVVGVLRIVVEKGIVREIARGGGRQEGGREERGQ